MTDTKIYDPYAACVESCTHDLARGVTLADLENEDGPYQSPFPTMNHLDVLAALLRSRDD